MRRSSAGLGCNDYDCCCNDCEYDYDYDYDYECKI